MRLYFEAQQGCCLLNPGEGVFDVALAFEVVEGFDVGTEDGVDGVDELVEGVTLSAGDVEDLAADAGGGAGEEVGFDVVGDVGEVARLGAVAVDDGAFAFADKFDEFGYDRAKLIIVLSD
jgi:hypothetical protein